MSELARFLMWSGALSWTFSLTVMFVAFVHWARDVRVARRRRAALRAMEAQFGLWSKVTTDDS